VIIAGNKLYEICGICGKLVQINKFLLASVHFCLTDEELSQRRKNDWNRSQPPIPEWLKKKES
jgi:hypothetical protein